MTQSFLMDAAKMAAKAGRDMERADRTDTGTFRGSTLKRGLLCDAQANLHAALARIDGALAELDAEERKA